MKVEFRASFVKDLKKLKEASIKKQVLELITLAENIGSFQEIINVKKLSGGEAFYRIRVGDSD